MNPLTVAALQTHPRFGEVGPNVTTALARLADLPASCDLAVLPELFATGYQFRSRREALELAEEIPTGPTSVSLREAARAHDLCIVAGLAERSGLDLYNSALLVRPDGSWEVYRKLHLFGDEKDIFTPGDLGLRVVQARGTRVGIMICFDWIFPETARTLALAGAALICHPAKLVLPHCPHSMLVRCIENRVFAVTANRVGSEQRTGPGLTFIGRSQVVNPDGERLAFCDEKNEGTAIATIDPDQTHKRVTPRNDLWEDRRPQMYRL